MKKILFILSLLTASVSFAQSKNEKVTLEVDGVCLMCKERIEKAAIKAKGVKSAQWDVNTHELSLIYNSKKTDLNKISESILAVGHDVEEKSASDEAYNSVHPCCKYRDEEVKDDHKED